MYQKFFSARDESAASKAVIGMVLGVVLIETTLALLAIVGRAVYPDLVEQMTVIGVAASETVILYIAAHGLPVILGARPAGRGRGHRALHGQHVPAGPVHEREPRHLRALHLARRVGEEEAGLQRAFVVLFGAWAAPLTQFDTVLAMALYAYSLVGASLTPALLAAFLWKRVTPAGGVACIAGGLGSIVGIGVLDGSGGLHRDDRWRPVRPGELRVHRDPGRDHVHHAHGGGEPADQAVAARSGRRSSPSRPEAGRYGACENPARAYADRAASASSRMMSATGRTSWIPATLRPACQKSRLPDSS
jgi:hypothetical protein